jgi:hypothetical protein
VIHALLCILVSGIPSLAIKSYFSIISYLQTRS